MEMTMKVGMESGEIEGKVLAESEVPVLEQPWAVGHFLFDWKVNELLHDLLLPLPSAPVLLRNEDGLNEVFLFGNDGVDFFFAAKVVLNWLLGDV